MIIVTFSLFQKIQEPQKTLIAFSLLLSYLLKTVPREDLSTFVSSMFLGHGLLMSHPKVREIHLLKSPTYYFSFLAS